MSCPFNVGEIAVFKSWIRFEEYIARVNKVHVDMYGTCGCPEIRKADINEKMQWYNSGKSELVIGKLSAV